MLHKPFHLQKLTFCLAFVFYFSFFTHAQELQTNKEQSTGETNYITTPARVYSKPVIGSTGNEQVYVSFYRRKEINALVLVVQSGRLGMANENEEGQLRLTFVNGDTMTLPVAKIDRKDDEMISNTNVFSQFFQLNDNNIQALKKNAVASVHLHYGKQDIDYPIAAGIFVERIKKAAHLIF